MSIEASKIVEWLKLSPKQLTGLVLVTGSYLLLTQKQLAYFGLATLDTKIRAWVAVGFLASAGFLLAYGSFELVSAVRARRQRRARRAAQLAALHNLTPEEQAILAAYIRQNTKSIRLPIQSGVTNGLEDAGIIYRASDFGTMGTGFAYNIQPWAWEHLHAHPELLGT